jgi:hypothetical protein
MALGHNAERGPQPSSGQGGSGVNWCARRELRLSQAHTTIMAAPRAPVPPYRVRVRRCTIHVGRFRWDILENGRPAESSPDSFFSRREAKADGLARLHELVTAHGAKKP